MNSRRDFVKMLGMAGGFALPPALVRSVRAEWGAPFSQSTLFTLGVASGDPRDDSVVLWTRLAPEPLDGGGMGQGAVDVTWKVATDPAMTNVVRIGVESAQGRNGHAVAVNVEGLQSDTWYYYQFSCLGETSRIGRTRTFPSPGATPSEMRFALVSCQDFEAGYYAAYRDIAMQDLDFVVHVGDYIYEGGVDARVPDPQRRHNGSEIMSVDDYRNRYALYRLDPHLQAAHAAFPFIVTFDDHEVDNNYAGLTPEDQQTAQAFLQRRSNAYQVYAETMPVRPNVHEKKGSINLYRSVNFGDLAEMFVLDTRQYRTNQPCGDGLAFCDGIFDPAATMMGSTQEEWLFRNLRQSRSTWKVMAQQVMMMRWDLGALSQVIPNLPPHFFNVDAWDGYQVARDRVMAFLAAEQIQNAVVLTGDIHSAWAANLKADFTDPSSAIVGAEFVCTSITSTFGDTNAAVVPLTLPSNPHIRFFDGLHRGYSRCTVTPERWRTDFRAVARVPNPFFTVPSPDIAVFDRASFLLRAGQPGLSQIV